MIYLSALFDPDRRKDRCIAVLNGESAAGQLAPPFVDIFVQDGDFYENDTDSVTRLAKFIRNCKFALGPNTKDSPSNAISNMQWPVALAVGYSSILKDFIIWHYDDKRPSRAGSIRRSRWLSGHLIDVVALDSKLVDDFKRTVAAENYEDEAAENENSMIPMVVSLDFTGKFHGDSDDAAMALSRSLNDAIAQILSDFRAAGGVRQDPRTDYRHRVQDDCECKLVPDLKKHRHVKVGYIRSDEDPLLDPFEFRRTALIAAAAVSLCLKESKTLHLLARLPLPVVVAVGYLLGEASRDDKEGDLRPVRELFQKSLRTYVYDNGDFRLWPQTPSASVAANVKS